MFLTKLLTELGTVFKISKRFSNISHKLFGTPGVSFYCFFMSILSGYPIGAKIISDLYSKDLITENDAKRMSIFCTTSGPIFVIGAVGVGMLKSYKLGLILYISHILSSIILGLVYNLIFKNKDYQTKIVFQSNKKSENIFTSCLLETINSLFLVGGYITIFYLISEAFELLKILEFISILVSKIIPFVSPETIKNFLFGILEVTRGAKELSSQSSPTISAICGLISFSGISIIMQSLSFLKQAKIKAHSFILSKCVLMVLSIIICKLILIFW
jgi:sporulation integral membrane protein YlbJ